MLRDSLIFKKNNILSSDESKYCIRLLAFTPTESDKIFRATSHVNSKQKLNVSELVSLDIMRE
jgi:hypothetical protein